MKRDQLSLPSVLRLNMVKPRYWHYWIGLLLVIACVPLLRRLHLPLRFDWITLCTEYWLVRSVQSVFAAVVLCLIGFREQSIVRPLVERYRREPLRIVLLLVYLSVLVRLFTGTIALVLLVDTIAVIEFVERKIRQPLHALAAILLPAVYLFAGVLLVFAYNDIIASVHFGFAYDLSFDAVDKWILRGSSVADLSHWAVQIFPPSFFRVLEVIYFGLFPQIGAGIILVALYAGKKNSSQYGLQYVGTILVAYYLTLGLFYLCPSQGPYYLRPTDFSSHSGTLQTDLIQKMLAARTLARWNHVPLHSISADYFIGFPSMHIALPLIVMWFLRRWKRMVIALCAYDSLLIVSILLLEWHYIVDIIGGALVGAVAIAITDGGVWSKAVVGPPGFEPGTNRL
jgi:hypothetical protein